MMKNPSLREIIVRAIVIAQGYANAGIHESGGNNHGDQIQFYLRMVGLGAGQPWCAAFVYTCLVKAYAQLTGQAEDREGLLRLGPKFSAIYKITRSGYCPTLWACFVHLGMTCGPGSAVPAWSIIFFDFHGQGEPHHVAFVSQGAAVMMPVRTIEGNTPGGHSGDQADGDGVHARIRSRVDVFGFAVAA